MAATVVVGQSQRPGKNVQALCIGIDAYRRGPLPNCVNDAKDMRKLLLDNGVPAGNVRLMVDEECTRRGILGALEELSGRAKPGDEVLVYYSGHGSHKRDRSGDEPDGADETWVTVELDQILDDELEQAFAKIPGTVYLISDSCHSGSVSKGIEIEDDEEIGKYLSPEEIAKGRGERVAASDWRPRDIGVKVRERQERRNASGGSASAGGSVAARLFASCSDLEVSGASRRRRNSHFTGELLRVLHATRGRRTTFGEVRDAVTRLLRNRASRYPQNPTLFSLQADLAIPMWLGGGGDSSRPQAAGAEARNAAARVNQIVDGLLRRTARAPAQQQDWIARLGTRDRRFAYRTSEYLELEVSLREDAPKVWLCVFNVGPTGNLTLLYPNGPDGNHPLKGGQTLHVGGRSSEVELQLNGEPGQEGIVAFALEWDPFVGVDFDALLKADNRFRFVSADMTSARRRGAATLMRARDIGVKPRRRAGEGWSKAVLTVSHR
ncbi:MAG: caspase family protein [Planctomycetota bacterium]